MSKEEKQDLYIEWCETIGKALLIGTGLAIVTMAAVEYVLMIIR